MESLHIDLPRTKENEYLFRMNLSVEAAREELYNKLKEKKINWELIEELLICLGDSINFYDEKYRECILSEAYLEQNESGKNILKLTEMFLEHGFDVHANGGKNGASCLRALCWSSGDKYVLHIAEKLLDAGADSRLSYDEDDENGVLDSIIWKDGCWATGEYETGNIMSAYYDLIKRHQDGVAYKGIRSFRDAVGEKVTRVERINYYNYEKEMCSAHLFHCGDKQLILYDEVELLINPYIRDEAVSVEEVSDEFAGIIGAKIKGLRYFNSTMAKLSFSNGQALLIYRMEDGNTEIKVTKRDLGKLPSVGTAFESIKLWESICHAPDSTYYSERTILLNTKEKTYALYFHGSYIGSESVRVEELDDKCMKDISRGVKIHKPILRHIEYAGDAIKWLSIQCDEGIMYIAPDGMADLAIFMSEVEMKKDEVRMVGHHTKGLKKIKFVG